MGSFVSLGRTASFEESASGFISACAACLPVGNGSYDPIEPKTNRRDSKSVEALNEIVDPREVPRSLLRRDNNCVEGDLLDRAFGTCGVTVAELFAMAAMNLQPFVTGSGLLTGQVLMLARDIGLEGCLDGDYNGPVELLDDLLKILGRQPEWEELLVQGYKMALRRSPTSVRHRAALSDVFIRSGNLAEAVQLLREGLALAENGADALLNWQLGMALMDNRNLFITTGPTSEVLQEAMEHLEKAASLEPDNVEFLTSVAAAFESSDELVKAYELYEKALALAPGDRPLTDKVESLAYWRSNQSFAAEAYSSFSVTRL